MSLIVRAEDAPNACPCCTGPLVGVWGPDKICSTCFGAGRHRCGAPTKKETPCKQWTTAKHCAQHTPKPLKLVHDQPTDEVQKSEAAQ